MHPIQLFLKNFLEGTYPRIHHSPPPPALITIGYVTIMPC